MNSLSIHCDISGKVITFAFSSTKICFSVINQEKLKYNVTERNYLENLLAFTTKLFPLLNL